MTNQLQFIEVGGVIDGIELSCKDGDLTSNDWETYRVRITEEQGGDEVYHPYSIFTVDCQMINAGVREGQSPCEQDGICNHSMQAVQHILSSQDKDVHFYQYILEAMNKFGIAHIHFHTSELIKIKSAVKDKRIWGVIWPKTTLEQRTEWFRGTVEESEGID